ncbi:SusF/SusE family outer membrane protein [Cesiribacter sp. SM1]|uniref:SusF/SusE family outer membrane protein n=1 Tax=Cesiribacter sp. SM1 TaxID=2861196 RepID=UPI001CD67126|nr:SusF/SusE family outer membrane protein [Cesiribacter sp. SM1]
MKNKVYSIVKSLNVQYALSKMLYLMAALLVLFSACEEDEITVPVLNRTPALTASAESLQLKQSQASQTALSFSWTPGSNQGTNAGIDYVLQIDGAGGTFESPVEINVGKGKYTTSFKVSDLNAFVKEQLQMQPHQQGTLQARIKAVVLGTELAPEFSNPVTVALTPYEEVTVTLYMIGDATPGGWSADNATELTVDENDPTIFRTQVQLVPGEYKFITTRGQFLPSYNKGAGNNALVYRTSDDQPDDKFRIEEGGLYKVTANLSDLTVLTEQMEGPPYTQLWGVGSAMPNGWDLDNAAPLVQSEADPFIFTYTGMLMADGELKIATAKDWGALFYRPTVADAPITHTAVELSAGDPDNKWKVAETGYYKVTINLNNLTIAIEPVNLYLVGDAGPNGWNIDTPAPMTKNGSIYTYTGPLTPGELKISKFKGGWCGGEWINSATADQAITNGAYITTQGCDGPDNKWRVTDSSAGNYSITIDLAAGTMNAVKQ